MPIEKAKPGPISRPEIDQELYNIGRLVLKMEAVEAGMQAAINAIKADHATELEGMRERIGGLAERLRLRVEDSRTNLLRGKRKKLALLMGTIGFRKQPDRLSRRPGLVEEDVILALKTRELLEYLRTREEIDKRAVATALREGRLDEAELGKLGLRIRRGADDFYYELDRDSVLKRMREDS